jgi:hypothetical protein
MTVQVFLRMTYVCAAEAETIDPLFLDFLKVVFLTTQFFNI